MYTMDQEELSDIAGIIISLNNLDLYEMWIKIQHEFSSENVIDIFFFLCENNKIDDLIKSKRFYDDKFRDI